MVRSKKWMVAPTSDGRRTFCLATVKNDEECDCSHFEGTDSSHRWFCGWSASGPSKIGFDFCTHPEALVEEKMEDL